MRVIALGVNGAFYTGHYESVVSLEHVKACLQLASTQSKSVDAIFADISSLAKKLYAPCWQSNFLLEFDAPNKRGKKGEPYRLLLDCGGDVRHALAALDLTLLDIDGVYISHAHSDHIGGLEGLAFVTFFHSDYTPQKAEWLGDKSILNRLLEQKGSYVPPPNVKPDLFVHPKVLKTLNQAMHPGLNSLQWLPFVDLNTYFNVIVGENKNQSSIELHRFKDGHRSWKMTPIFVLHAIGSSEVMPAYGVSLVSNEGYCVLFPTDTQHMTELQRELLQVADVIYMDCETAPIRSGVHPHITSLIYDLPSEIQQKCYLYHYQEPPEISEGLFKSCLKAGDVHLY